MERRIGLTNEEALQLSQELHVLHTGFVKDEYTGEKRIRTTETEVVEKDYPTPVSGVIYRFSSQCRLGKIENVWFEFKWTENKKRFEIEFEGEIPIEYRERPNIPGWDILR